MSVLNCNRLSKILSHLQAINDKNSSKCTSESTENKTDQQTILDTTPESFLKLVQNQNKNWSINQKLALCARILSLFGHGNDLLAGQITYRPIKDKLEIFTQPFGYGIDELNSSSFIKINANLTVLGGNSKEMPNPANNFHLQIYNRRPDINCIIHCHSPNVSTLSIIKNIELMISHSDTMSLYDDITYLYEWEGLPFGDREGIIIANALGTKYNNIILANHGYLCMADTIERALFRSYWIEKSAKMLLNAMQAIGDINSYREHIKSVNEKYAKDAKKFNLTDGFVKIHFNYWARKAIDKYGKHFLYK